MNISGVSYNGTMQNTEQTAIQPLQNEGSKGVLTGMKLSEGKRLDSWEITHVQSENSVSLANTYQPGGIKVVRTEDRHYLRNTEQYFGVFEQYAKGQLSEDELTAYSAAFESNVKCTLNADGVWGIKALAKEMKENISKGIANTPDKQNPMWEGYYIGGTNTQPVASNTKMISEITEAFSKIDPNDKSTYDAAVDKFEDVMRPWETIFASYVARQAPGYAATYVQDKEYYSRKAFQAIWNGTY